MGTELKNIIPSETSQTEEYMLHDSTSVITVWDIKSLVIEIKTVSLWEMEGSIKETSGGMRTF